MVLVLIAVVAVVFMFEIGVHDGDCAIVQWSNQWRCSRRWRYIGGGDRGYLAEILHSRLPALADPVDNGVKELWPCSDYSTATAAATAADSSNNNG